MEDKRYVQDDVAVSIIYTSDNDLEVTPEEVQAYINRFGEKKSDGDVTRSSKLIGLTLRVEGEEVDISYEYANEAFERIRRIIGYLVGTLDRFNNGKRAEVEDRVKHSITDDCEDVYVDDKPKNKGVEIGD